MSITEIIKKFLHDIQQAQWYEYMAVVAGIVSVWCSRMESIWVYPVGLVNTITYIYLSFEGHLLGEATVNFYYTIMSIWGWYLWLKKDTHHQRVLHITFSNRKDWMHQVGFFLFFYVALFFSLLFFKENFFKGVIPWADAFASATAFTGMWLMTKKKVESWYWWIATNIASIPLYFVKHFVLTSVYYVILLALAVIGYITWKRKAEHKIKR